VCDPNEGGDVAAEIEQSVELDRSLRSAEACPGEEIETEIDGGGVESVNRLLQFETEGVIRIDASGLVDESLCKVGVDAPIAVFVGISQSAPRDPTPKTHVIELARNHTKTRFDVPQTLAICQLSEGHGKELVPA